MQRMRAQTWVVAVVVAATLGAACGKKPAPVLRTLPPPPATTGDAELGSTPAPPAPPPPIRDEPPVTPSAPVDPSIGIKDLDALNRESPLGPVFFALDSFELSDQARTDLQASAQVLRRNTTWQITVEGHCDERGTAEYNLSLGERRALVAKAYLVSLGVAADRLRTVSYGKEFPFDPGHDDAAWAKNRRAHFVITAK